MELYFVYFYFRYIGAINEFVAKVTQCLTNQNTLLQNNIKIVIKTYAVLDKESKV